MVLTGVNWIAVILGGIFNMFLGFLWYGPLFGKIWLSIIGKKEEEIQGESGLMYVVPLLMSLISALVLAILINSMGITSWHAGLAAGAVVYLGIAATSMVTTNVFEEGKAGTVILFTAYQLIVHMAEGAVFAVW